MTKHHGDSKAKVLLAWICSLDTYFAREETTKGAKLNFANILLNGFAALWHQTQEVQRTMARTWTQFKQRIKEQFLSHGFDLEILLEWDDFTQNIGETARAYTDQFWTLLLKVQTIETNTKEEQARKFFNKLHGSLWSEVKCFNPKKLSCKRTTRSS